MIRRYVISIFVLIIFCVTVVGCYENNKEYGTPAEVSPTNSSNNENNAEKNNDSAEEKEKLLKLKNVKAGDVIELGSVQRFNGKHCIEWIVLTISDGKALLLSKYAVAGGAYCDTKEELHWENAPVRKWLNGYFFDTSFSTAEKDLISEVMISEHKNPDYIVYDGITTYDKIFVLSVTEVDKYLTSDAQRQCEPTEYARVNGVEVTDGKCRWWLRTRSPQGAIGMSFVDEDGNVNRGGVTPLADSCGVRPALWLDLTLLDDTNDDDEQDSKAPMNVGDYITFGVYEQDIDQNNGKEAIDWLVLDIQDGKALVISKYSLDAYKYNPYDAKYGKVTWETCDLRKWLNDDFWNAAFSEEEKAKILITTVPADNNPKYDTDPGNATQDAVFVLSVAEINKYFSSEESLSSTSTAYACQNGVGVSLHDGSFSWWLRTPGCSSTRVVSVNSDGKLDSAGLDVYYRDIGVRPAMWITVE